MIGKRHRTLEDSAYDDNPRLGEKAKREEGKEKLPQRLLTQMATERIDRNERQYNAQPSLSRIDQSAGMYREPRLQNDQGYHGGG